MVGYAEYPAQRHFTGTDRLAIEQWMDLAAIALDDAGIDWADVDGLACAGDVAESAQFMPATIAEYCGWSVNFAERLDLGGAASVGMVWRAAAAIELGLCDVVVCVATGRNRPHEPGHRRRDDARYQELMMYGASSNVWGSPQAEFEIPFGNVGQNGGYAMYAQAYHDAFGWNERARAKIAADQRISAAVNPSAAFYGKPITVDEVLDSRMIADPLRMFEIVMPVTGGGAVVVTSRERAKDTKHRPVVIAGCGERLTHKTPTFAPDLTSTPVGPAAASAFGMAGIAPAEVDMVQIYDCYTITALLSIEDSGFCAKGEGMDFVDAHDLSYLGDFPCNTHGGQLGFGQPMSAGGMTQVVEAVRQIQGRADERQLASHDIAYVTGTGGVMSEQNALVVRGE